MPYSAEISTANPSCFLFLVDQSGSMDEPMNPINIKPMETPITMDGVTYTEQADGLTKAEEVAKIINRLLLDLLLKCSPQGDARNYFDIGVIGYSGNEQSEKVKSIFKGNLTGRDIVHMEELSKEPFKSTSEAIKQQGPDGNMIETIVNYPLWIEASAHGGTPMSQAFRLAKRWLTVWLKEGNHIKAFPPIVINITDGEPNHGDNPTVAAQELMSLSTDDGNILLFNIQIGKKQEAGIGEIIFPYQSDKFSNNANAKMLYNISSELPPKFVRAAEQSGFSVADNSRGFSYNANMETLVSFLEIGTRGAEPKSDAQ